MLPLIVNEESLRVLDQTLEENTRLFVRPWPRTGALYRIHSNEYTEMIPRMEATSEDLRS